MSAKMVKISPTKAYRIEGIIAQNGEPMISIRQMYATKNDPEFKFGRKGITIDLDAAARVFKAVRAAVQDGEDTFTDLRN